MAEPFTEQEYEERRGYMECIDGMHEPPYDSEYDQMTVNVGEMLRLYATIDYLLTRPRLSLAELKAMRQMYGLCMLCGASRGDPGEGCYKWAPVNPYVEVWSPHSWPEETPVNPQRRCTECGSITGSESEDRCLACTLPREQFDDEPIVRQGPHF